MDRMDNKPMDKGVGSSPNMNKAGRDTKNVVSDAKGIATEMVNKLGEKFPENFDEQFEMVKRNAQVALDRTESLVRQYPLYSILGAAAVGAIVGSLFSGSRSEKYYEH
jgi:ElaB/YqjD/DUF883 family membrane-anchored ribosome-binding protein